MGALWGRKEWRMLWDVYASPTFVRYVWPYFRLPYWVGLAHGSFISRPEDFDRSFTERLDCNARTITDHQIETLLASQFWHARVCGAWYAGLNRRSSFGPRIGELLLQARPHPYEPGRTPAPSYCIALGLIGGEVCQQYLNTYAQSAFADIFWAIGALAYLEGAPSKYYFDWLATLEKSEGETWKDAPRVAVETFEKLVAFLEHRHMLARKV